MYKFKGMEIQKINLVDKFSLFSEYWSPKIIGELNGQHIKLVKAKGTFDWHKHENEDELFFVVKGSFVMELEGKDIQINEGELIVIPKGTMHRPVANEEILLMLFEPISTLNTGSNPDSKYIRKDLEWI